MIILVDKNNATCSICGKSYYMCNACTDFKTLYPYKLHTDTPTHFQIYQVIHGYSTGIYNKNEAKEKLLNIDLSDLDTFRDNIKAVIIDILDMGKTTESREDIDKVFDKSTKRKSAKTK